MKEQQLYHINIDPREENNLFEGQRYREYFDLKKTFRQSIVKSYIGPIILDSNDTHLTLSLDQAITKGKNQKKVIAVHLMKI